jgi:SAM-dependent methyltransferase
VQSSSAAVSTLRDTWPLLVSAQARLHEVRERDHRNHDGGDAGHQWDHGLVIRHAVNYAAAVGVAASVTAPGPLVDVGAGAGGFSVWAAAALERSLVMVDQDAGHRELASRAFPAVEVRASVDGLPQAPVVMVMEVIEHVDRSAQSAFVREVAGVVAPGGVLVMSTPDESGYWGGWSGYPPHIATLDADGLQALLSAQLPGWNVEVLRLNGPEFALSTAGRYGVPVANRVWGSLENHLPQVTSEISYRLNQLGKRRTAPTPPVPSKYRIHAASSGTGTGLLARAQRPSTDTT